MTFWRALWHGEWAFLGGWLWEWGKKGRQAGIPNRILARAAQCGGVNHHIGRFQ